MLHTKFHGNWPCGSGEEDFLRLHCSSYLSLNETTTNNSHDRSYDTQDGDAHDAFFSSCYRCDRKTDKNVIITHLIATAINLWR